MSAHTATNVMGIDKLQRSRAHHPVRQFSDVGMLPYSSLTQASTIICGREAGRTTQHGSTML